MEGAVLISECDWKLLEKVVHMIGHRQGRRARMAQFVTPVSTPKIREKTEDISNNPGWQPTATQSCALRAVPIWVFDGECS